MKKEEFSKTKNLADSIKITQEENLLNVKS